MKYSTEYCIDDGYLCSKRRCGVIGKCRNCGAEEPEVDCEPDAPGHDMFITLTCPKCGKKVTEELWGPDEDRTVWEIEGIVCDRWNSGNFDDGEVSPEIVNEDTKVTLTVKQIKSLLKESVVEPIKVPIGFIKQFVKAGVAKSVSDHDELRSLGAIETIAYSMGPYGMSSKLVHKRNNPTELFVISNHLL